MGEPSSSVTGVLIRRGYLDTQRDNRGAHEQRNDLVKNTAKRWSLTSQGERTQKKLPCQHTDPGLLASRAVRKYNSVD